MPHEIHPETPIQGRDITELFSQFDVDHVITTCRDRAMPYGITFGDLKWLSNSRLALEAAEFARETENYHLMHETLFKAYFSDGLDIGDMKVILDLGEQCGLDRTELRTSLDSGRFTARVRQGSEEAKRRGVTAVPTFFIEDQPPLTGAQSEDVFRAALEKAFA